MEVYNYLSELKYTTFIKMVDKIVSMSYNRNHQKLGCYRSNCRKDEYNNDN